MLKLTARRRSLLADTVADAANVAAGALFFGQFLGDRPLSLAAMAGGLAA